MSSQHVRILREQLESLEPIHDSVPSSAESISLDQFLENDGMKLKKLSDVLKNNKYGNAFYKIAMSQFEDLIDSLTVIADDISDNSLKLTCQMFINGLKKFKECC